MSQIYLSNRDNAVVVVDHRHIDLYHDYSNARERLLLVDEFEEGFSCSQIVKVWQSRTSGHDPYEEVGRSVLFDGSREEAERLFDGLRLQASSIGGATQPPRCETSAVAWGGPDEPVQGIAEKAGESNRCCGLAFGVLLPMVIAVSILYGLALDRKTQSPGDFVQQRATPGIWDDSGSGSAGAAPATDTEPTVAAETGPSRADTIDDLLRMYSELKPVLPTGDEVDRLRKRLGAGEVDSADPADAASRHGAEPEVAAGLEQSVQAPDHPQVPAPAPHEHYHGDGGTTTWPGQSGGPSPIWQGPDRGPRESVILDMDSLPPLSDQNRDTPVSRSPAQSEPAGAPEPWREPVAGGQGADGYTGMGGVSLAFPGAQEVMPEEALRGEPFAPVATLAEAVEADIPSSNTVDAGQADEEGATDAPETLPGTNVTDEADNQDEVAASLPEDGVVEPLASDAATEAGTQEGQESTLAEAPAEEDLSDEELMRARMLAAIQQVDDPQEILSRLNRLNTRIRRGEKVTPSMLEGLPEVIAKEFRNSGAVDEDEEVEELVSLSGKAMPKNRYGIPTVPQENMWAYYNGNVVIPLPGGGTIQQPDDMEDFGLEP